MKFIEAYTVHENLPMYININNIDFIKPELELSEEPHCWICVNHTMLYVKETYEKIKIKVLENYNENYH